MANELRSAGQVLFARDGLLRGNVGRWRDYLSPDFHPRQQDDALSRDWLRNNSSQFVAVGQRA